MDSSEGGFVVGVINTCTEWLLLGSSRDNLHQVVRVCISKAGATEYLYMEGRHRTENVDSTSHYLRTSLIYVVRGSRISHFVQNPAAPISLCWL